MVNNTNRLFFIDVLRTICILLLVLDHSFAIYSGVWPKVYAVENIPLYFWVGRFCCAFMLPLWFFISGYLWGFQIFEKKKIVTYLYLIKNKGKRLLLPCYFFGFLFIICTGNIFFLFSYKGLFSFLSGVQHLWFLPVLFWIFLVSYFLHNHPIKDFVQIIILFILSIISWNVMLLGIGGALHYLLYFQLGYFALKYKKEVNRIMTKKSVIALTSIVFFSLFVPLTNLLLEITPQNVSSVYERSISQILIHLTTMPLEITGIVLCYAFAIVVKCEGKVGFFIGKFATYSFGVYLFHHFVLTYLYYDTAIVSNVNSMLLPLVSFGISITTSVLATYILKQCKWTRILVS